MREKFISETVDIYTFPSSINFDYNKDDVITVGDLHANAMKLLYILVRHGIITNMTEQDYKECANIYKTNFLFITESHINEFDSILNKLIFENSVKLRLIGDELADRGQNDYFILRILEQMNKYQVLPEILLSNHGYEFILSCETNKSFDSKEIGREYSGSCYSLQLLVDKGLVLREAMLGIYEKTYKPLLKSITYQSNDDFSEITIASHAAIGLNTIQDIAKILKVTYADNSGVELVQTLNTINAKFQTHVTGNAIHLLMTRDSPFDFLVWNRDSTHLDRPEKMSNYKLNFVHGHDSKDLTHGNIYNLNNELGCGIAKNKGEYTYLYTQKNTVDLVNEKEQESITFFGSKRAGNLCEKMEYEHNKNLAEILNNPF